MTIDVATVPASLSGGASLDLQEGRHRRIFPDLVVHLVFDDLSEVSLGPDTAVGRSLGHMASWLVEH